MSEKENNKTSSSTNKPEPKPKSSLGLSSVAKSPQENSTGKVKTLKPETSNKIVQNKKPDNLSNTAAKSSSYKGEDTPENDLNRLEEKTNINSLDNLIKKWKKFLNILIIQFYFCFFLFFSCFISTFFISNKFLTFFTFIIFISIIAYFSFKNFIFIKLLKESFVAELLLPLKLLFANIQKISSQDFKIEHSQESLGFAGNINKEIFKISKDILEHQRFVDRVVDNMFEMMFLINKDGFVLKLNTSACKNTKYQPEEILGKHIKMLFPHSETVVDYFLEMQLQFTSKGMIRDLDIHIQTSEGDVLPFSINGVKVEDSNGQLLGYTIIAKNQAETYRLIHQLNKSNYDLENANQELAKRYDFIKNEIEQKEGQRKLLELELATSQLVQRTFLSQAPMSTAEFECAGSAIPAAFCGGDWWNSISIDKKLYIFIGDVTGHGTASAMVTAAVSGYFVSVEANLKANKHIELDQILLGFDRVLKTMASKDILYNMTCLACLIDFEQKTIKMANAGHTFPLAIKKNSTLDALTVNGEQLGNPRATAFEVREYPLDDISFMFFYTDGLIENKNDHEEQYGKRRLRKYIEKNKHLGAKEFIDTLVEESHSFYGINKALEDDVTIVAVKLHSLE